MRHHKECFSILTAGRWPWKSESAKECVTTHLPNGEASKMDDAKVVLPMEDLWYNYISVSRGDAVVCVEASGRPGVEQPQMLILVVVAIT